MVAVVVGLQLFKVDDEPGESAKLFSKYKPKASQMQDSFIEAGQVCYGTK